MRRITQGVALAAALTLGLAACSSSDSGGDDGGSDAQSGTSLTIWADEKRAAPIGDLAKSWGEENGVDVMVEQVNYDKMQDQFTQQAPQGQGPDILLGGNDWTGDFVKSGLVAPVELGSSKDSFVTAAVDAFNIDGQNYGLPIATENIVLFRNTKLAPEAPKSLNEMGETGLKLKEDGKTQYPVGLQVGDEGDAYHSFPFFSAAGGYYFGGPDADGSYDTTDIGLTSEGGMAWADAFSDWGKKGIVKSTFVGDDLISAWSNGKLAYWITGPWNVEVVQKAEKKDVPFEAEGLPTWDGSDEKSVPIVGAQGFFLNQDSNNKTTAQAFLDATMNTEFMDSLYEADPRPPAWKDSLSAAEDDPIIKAVSEFGADGFPNLPIAAMKPMYEEFGLAEKRILDGKDPKTTMDEAQANVEKRINE
jgi:arabinogalactan oligomer/maltooligosaccharide transport system substrate-binding protein